MKLDMRDMLAGAVKVLPFSFCLTPPTDRDDLCGRFDGVRFPTPLTVEGSVVNSAGYMRLSATLSIRYVAPCARCLCDVQGSFSLSLDKTVAQADVAKDMDEDTLDDHAVIEDGFLDLDEQLLDLLFMEFPYKILCDEDCKGLCPTCGTNLNEHQCDCTEQLDPRLAPLADLLKELREKEAREASETPDTK